MPNWFVVVVGIVLLIVAYVLVYPQSLIYAVIVGVIGIYALAEGLGIPGVLNRSRKKPQ